MIPHDSKWNWNHTMKLLLSLNLCEWIKTWSFHCIAPFQSFISESTPKLQEAFKPNLLVSGAVLWCMCLTKGWVKANCNREIHAFLLLTMNVSASAKKNQSGNNNSIVSVIEISLFILILMYRDTSSEGTKQKTVILPNRRHRWIHRSWSFRSILPGKMVISPIMCIYII